MIVLGDISGIQSYLFDVAEEGGGQAQRLRGRSFLIQLMAEAAALLVLRNLGWPLDNLVLSGAGKFVLQGPDAAGQEEQLAEARSRIEDWLLREARGELRLSVAHAGGAEVEAYRQAQRQLQQAKARPWAPRGEWGADRLLLQPLGTPCPLCRHATAEEREDDPDTGMPRSVCRWCARGRWLGQRLPRARWLRIQDGSPGDFELFGLAVTLSEAGRLAVEKDTLAVANLREAESRPPWCPQEKFLPRRLMAHVPAGNGGPIWFVALAGQARGDHLLAVLKADADSLGQAFAGLLESNSDLRPLTRFSRELDAFFAGGLKDEIERDPRWRWVYTVFAGGDDLIMVGPWDVMLDFASRLHELFAKTWGDRGLTLSAGVALIKPKRPIKAAVAEAERLLEQAKTGKAPCETQPKDQLACFGQMWKWKHHPTVLQSARQLADWVDAGQMERGWLHTLLSLVEARHPTLLLDRQGPAIRPDFLATARLAHHVGRNYRQNTEAGRWARRLVEWFDDPTHLDVRYLPAAVRYALTATRTPGGEE